MTETLYDRVGGEAGISRLVEAFYARMDGDPRAAGIRAMHGADLGPTKRTLTLYLGEWLGGPKTYSAVKGHPRLRQRHIRFPIGEAERDAWLVCMRTALEETILDTTAREEIFGNMRKLADWMRNQSGNPHDAMAGMAHIRESACTPKD